MMAKRRFLDDQPGGYDPLAETARRFEVEPLRLRPEAEIGLEGGSGPGGPSMPPAMIRALQQRLLQSQSMRDFVPDDPNQMAVYNGVQRDPEQWHKDATQHPGSWWTDWAGWVSEYAGDKVPARVPGKGKLKAIEAAPGAYAKMRVDKG